MASGLITQDGCGVIPNFCSNTYYPLVFGFPMVPSGSNSNDCPYQMPIKHNQLIGNNSDSVFTVAHNLSTSDVAVSVMDFNTKQMVIVAVEVTNDTTVTVDFGTNVPTNNQYKVTVLG